MRKYKYVILLFLIIIFTGCSNSLENIQNLSYNTSNVNKVREIELGVVKSIKTITIKDDGKGTLLGGSIGALVGSKIKNSEGAVAGAVIGGALTNKIIETKGQELTINLDNGKLILVGIVGDHAIDNMRVKILIEGNKIIALEPSSEPVKVTTNKKLQVAVSKANKIYENQNKSPKKFKLINNKTFGSTFLL